MLKIIDGGSPNVLRIKTKGKLTEADHTKFRASLESLIQRFDSIRVYLDVSESADFDVCSKWDDPQSCLRWKDGVKRFALIGKPNDKYRERKITEVFVTVRFFPTNEADKAWEWVTEGADEEIDNEYVRHLAYAKWEAAGRPESDGVQFWLEAQRELHHA